MRWLTLSPVIPILLSMMLSGCRATRVEVELSDRVQKKMPGETVPQLPTGEKYWVLMTDGAFKQFINKIELGK